MAKKSPGIIQRIKQLQDERTEVYKSADKPAKMPKYEAPRSGKDWDKAAARSQGKPRKRGEADYYTKEGVPVVQRPRTTHKSGKPAKEWWRR